MFFLIFVVIVLGRVFISMLTLSLFHGAYYAGTSQKRLQKILKLAEVKASDKVVDLGSGDGRIVKALADAGAEVTGIEINPWLVFKSRRLIEKAGLEKKTSILRQNLWKHDLGQYDTVIIYGISHIMKDLEEKLEKELKPGAKFISVYFKLPVAKPVETAGDIYLYQF